MTRLTEGSGTGACALKVTLLLETLALRKTLVNRAFRHDVYIKLSSAVTCKLLMTTFCVIRG